MLRAPWRLATFAVATAALVAFAPYSGDPTWDAWDAGFMSALTFATAPWTVGCLYRAARGQRRWSELYVAACVWMASASWSYDLYILLRDGLYPPSALANIPASSILYLAGGLFWSLDWRPGRGVTFAFLEADWPAAGARGAFPRILGYAVAFMALVTVTLALVFWPRA
jgi:hypothetical protein